MSGKSTGGAKRRARIETRLLPEPGDEVKYSPQAQSAGGEWWLISSKALDSVAEAVACIREHAKVWDNVTALYSDAEGNRPVSYRILKHVIVTGAVDESEWGELK